MKPQRSLGVDQTRRKSAKVARDEFARELGLREIELAEVTNQKSALDAEIHHRVGNTLQVVLSLLSLQERRLTDPAARAAMAQTRRRVGALAMINTAIYQGPGLRYVDLTVFLEALIAELVTADVDGERGLDIVVAVNLLAIEAVHLPPLALFVAEALLMMLDQIQTGGQIAISVDSSPGVAKVSITGSDAASLACGEHDLAYTLMHTYARQLAGNVSFVDDPAPTLALILTFPILS